MVAEPPGQKLLLVAVTLLGAAGGVQATTIVHKVSLLGVNVTTKGEKELVVTVASSIGVKLFKVGV